MSASAGSSKNLKDPKEGPVDLTAQGGLILDCDCSSHARSCCNLASVGVAWSVYTVGGGCLVAMLVLMKVSSQGYLAHKKLPALGIAIGSYAEAYCRFLGRVAFL